MAPVAETERNPAAAAIGVGETVWGSRRAAWEGDMEGFDANRDCVTRMEIPVEDVLKAALHQPFDGRRTPGRLWSHHAALSVLKDFSWRNDIGRVLKDCDIDTRVALTERVADIISAVVKPVVSDLKDSLTVARLEAVKLESEVSRLELELQEQTRRRIELEYALGDAKAEPVNDDIWSRELVILGDDSFIIRVRHQDIARMAKAVEAYNGESEAA
jgi:hypothetical protein